MLFMNEYDIDDAVRLHGTREDNFGRAVRALDSLRNAVDANSDGWAYWSKPVTAAKRLQELILYCQDQLRRNGDVPLITDQKLTAALAPVKAFRTRHDLKFPVTDAERALGARQAAAVRADARDREVTELAAQFHPVLDSMLADADHASDWDAFVATGARRLAEIATP